MNAYDFTVSGADGDKVDLKKYKNYVSLIVNTASKCGYTPQLAVIQTLYAKYKAQGFVAIAFPCHQFGHQEPLSDKEISPHYAKEYGVDYPIMAKIEVNGPNADPFYQYLARTAKTDEGEEAIRWNFTKFLINKDGKVLKRYDSAVDPMAIEDDIKTVLASL